MSDKIIRYNEMGSEVQEGFQCKPVYLDRDKPVMYYKSHILVCNGERCQKANRREDNPLYVRNLTKECGLSKGKDRIKVTKVNCFGACRYGGVILIYENPIAGTSLKNNGLWVKKTHKYTPEDWKEIFNRLANDKSVLEYTGEDAIIPMEVYD